MAIDKPVHAPLPPKDTLLSLRTGKVRPFGGVNFRTAINKRARQGKWEVTPLGLVGDEHHYIHHGGPDKALHQYCASHYDAWNEELPGRNDLFQIGGFGENLSSKHMSEHNVCIGDIFQLGDEVVIQVTQPRQPCYKLNHRFQHKKASSMTQSTGRTGWYLRVLKPGFVKQGDNFELTDRIHPTWPLSRVQKYLYHDKDNQDALAELSNLPALGDEMLGIFRSRLANGAEDMSGRLEGERLPVVWRPYKLTEKTDLTPRVKKFTFEAEDNGDGTEYGEFGQFPFVRLQFGPDASFSRAYSVVSGNPRQFQLGIARDDRSRGGSIYMHDQLHVGDMIKIAKGHDSQTDKAKAGCLAAQVSRHIFIIGGIGITAFVSKIEELSRTPDSLEVHYAVRSRTDAAFLDRLPLEPTTLYAKDQGQRLDLRRAIPRPVDDYGIRSAVYCCGPTSLMNACRDLVTELGYTGDCLHFEEFGDASTGTGEPFEAEVKETGQVLQVPGEKSLLQVLTDAGFEVESSCLVGNCGTCMVDHCGGKVEHRGVALDEEQKKDSMLSCVSRGKGRIVIDF